MVHESLETRQFGFIYPVWYRAKQPDKAEYQKRPKPHKKAPRFSVAVLLLLCHLHCLWSFQVIGYSLSPRRPHVGPCRGLFVGMATWSVWAGKPTTGQTWGSRGVGIRDTPSKLRTVRKLDRMSIRLFILFLQPYSPATPKHAGCIRPRSTSRGCLRLLHM